MSNLLRWPSGQIAMRVAVIDQLMRRIRRYFKRNTNIAFEDWLQSGKNLFDYATVLGLLNEDHDQEILDLIELIDRIQKQEITENLSIYVNSVTGDDINGKGTFAQPYQTIRRALLILPDFINSIVDIRLSGNFSESLRNIRFRIGTEGQISFQGIDDPTIIDGPYTINTWTNISAGGNTAHSINVIGAPFVAEALRTYFVRMTSGVQSGLIYAIAHNTTGDIIIGPTSLPAAPGDTFEILRPTTSIIDPDPDYYIDFATETDSGINDGARIIFYGLEIISNGIKFINKGPLLINMPFCRTGGIYLESGNMQVNGWNWFDDTVAVNPLLTVNNNTSTYMYGVETEGAFQLSLNRTVTRFAYLSASLNYIYQGTMENAYNHNRNTATKFENVYFHNAGSTAIEANKSNIIDMDKVWFEQCSIMLDMNRGNSYIKNQNGTIANISGVNMKLGPGVAVSFDGVLLSPAAGDCQWRSTAATVAFPAVAGTSITDNNGSFVVKMS